MQPPPSRITYHAGRHMLEVQFGTQTFELPAELLRVYSPSAEVRGHSEHERRLQTGKKHVAVTGIEPVGNYAIRLTFDDGHDTGLYAWEFLYELGANKEDFWRRYNQELDSANASRLPPIAVQTFTPSPTRPKR